MVVAIRVNEAVLGLLMIVAFYWAVAKPWYRERRIGPDGVLLVALGTLWFQDPLMNYGQVWFTYNSAALNLGCPQCYLPGWLSSADNYAEPLYGSMFYFGLLWLCVKGGTRLMAHLQRRWPQMGRIGTFIACLGCFIAFDLVLETFWMRLGLYTYAGATGPLILFRGHYYQVAFHEIFFTALWFTAVTAACYFRTDRGEMLSERGLDALRVNPGQRTVLRFLAVVGLVHFAGFVSFVVPMSWVAMVHNDWTKDVIGRPYFTHGICGPGTTYACPSGDLPIHRDGATRITPDGKLFVPDGS